MYSDITNYFLNLRVEKMSQHHDYRNLVNEMKHSNYTFTVPAYNLLTSTFK